MQTPFIILKPLILFASMFSLLSCGGSNTNFTNDSAHDSATMPPVQAPLTYQFKVPVTTFNECGDRVPHPQAEVILHDDNWDIVARQLTDENGFVDFTLERARLNVSVVTTRSVSVAVHVHESLPPESKEVPETRFDLFPQLEMRDYSSAKGLNYEYRIDELPEAECDCAQGLLSISFPADDYRLTSTGFSNFVASGSSPGFVEGDVTVCKQDGNWPVRRFTAESNSTEQTLRGIITDFDELLTNGSQHVNVDLEAMNIPVAQSQSGFASLVIHNEVNGISYIAGAADQNTIRYYESERAAAGALARIEGAQRSYPNDIFTNSKKSIYTTDALTATSIINDIPLVEISNAEAVQLLESRRYDFRDKTEFPFVELSMNFSGEGAPAIAEITLSGKTVGTLPSFEQYLGYEQLFSMLNPETTWLNVTFFDYPNMEGKSASTLSGSHVFRPEINTENYETHYARMRDSVFVEVANVYPPI